MRIVGLSGQMRTAKDTISDRLKLLLGNEWNRFAFATSLKQIYCDSFDVDLDFIEKWKVRNEHPPDMDKTVREGLQLVGDDFREIMPTIWVKKVFRHIQSNKARLGDNYIISDARYLNEADAIKSTGGIVILVWRKGWENDLPNRSEQEVKPTVLWCRDSGEEGLIKNFNYPNPPPEKNLFDIFIRNEGTLDDLCQKVDSWLLKLAKEHFYGNR